MAGENLPEYVEARRQEEAPFAPYPDTDPELLAITLEDAEMCTELAADQVGVRAEAAARTGARNNYEADIANFVLTTLAKL